MSRKMFLPVSEYHDSFPDRVYRYRNVAPGNQLHCILNHAIVGGFMGHCAQSRNECKCAGAQVCQKQIGYKEYCYVKYLSIINDEL